MKYLYWILAIVVLGGGIGMCVYFGLQPKSIPKITYSNFERPGQLADAIILRMNQDLKQAPLLFLGVMPGRKMDLEVWKAFLEQSEMPEIKYQVVVADPELPHLDEYFPSAVKMDLKKDMDRFIEGARNAKAQGLRMAVILPTVYASQVLTENPVKLLKQSTDLRPLSFVLAGFPRLPEQENAMDIPCVMGPGDHEGTGNLGCEVQKKSRTVYRKKSKPGMYEGLMDQIGESDYLILFNAPAATAN